MYLLIVQKAVFKLGGLSDRCEYRVSPMFEGPRMSITLSLSFLRQCVNRSSAASEPVVQP